MTTKSIRILGLCLVTGGSLLLSAHSASAQEGPTPGNPLGVYLGAGLGLSTIRQDSTAGTGGLEMARRTTGWDAFLGIRPVPYLGAEVGYLDFGSAHSRQYAQSYGFGPDEAQLHESADAPVAFAVGYIPLQPWWDVYLKAGGARLHKSWYAIRPGPLWPPADYCDWVVDGQDQCSYAGEHSSWDVAYGVGTQVNFGPVTWRLEYVRVNANSAQSGGDPDLLSVGATWSFF